jgi:hypothetical protein
MNKSTGVVLLAIYLILGGLFAIVPQFTFPYAGMVHAVLGIAAGVLLLMKR